MHVNAQIWADVTEPAAGPLLPPERGPGWRGAAAVCARRRRAAVCGGQPVGGAAVPSPGGRQPRAGAAAGGCVCGTVGEGRCAVACRTNAHSFLYVCVYE
jgi:hypothetical protein